MININQAVTLTFSLKYLVNCSKSTSLSQKVQLIAEQAQSILYILRQYSNLTVEQVQSILYILHSTLILPVGERGVAVEACVELERSPTKRVKRIPVTNSNR